MDRSIDLAVQHTYFASAQAGAKDDQGYGYEGAWLDKGQDSRQGDKEGLINIIQQTSKKVAKKLEDYSETEITAAFQTQCMQFCEWHQKQIYSNIPICLQIYFKANIFRKI